MARHLLSTARHSNDDMDGGEDMGEKLILYGVVVLAVLVVALIANEVL